MLNVCIIQGKVLKDIEPKELKNGGKVATFTIINTRDTRNRNGGRDSDFIDIVAWDDLAAFIAENFSKGDRIIIVGRLQKRAHENASGSTVKQMEVVAEKAYFGGAFSGDANEASLLGGLLDFER